MTDDTDEPTPDLSDHDSTEDVATPGAIPRRPWRCRLGRHAWLAVPLTITPPYPPRDLTPVEYAGFTVFCQRCRWQLKDRERRMQVIDEQWGADSEERWQW